MFLLNAIMIPCEETSNSNGLNIALNPKKIKNIPFKFSMIATKIKLKYISNNDVFLTIINDFF